MKKYKTIFLRSSVSSSDAVRKPSVRRLASSTSAFSDDFNDEEDGGIFFNFSFLLEI